MSTRTRLMLRPSPVVLLASGLLAAGICLSLTAQAPAAIREAYRFGGPAAGDALLFDPFNFQQFRKSPSDVVPTPKILEPADGASVTPATLVTAAGETLDVEANTRPPIRIPYRPSLRSPYRPPL